MGEAEVAKKRKNLVDISTFKLSDVLTEVQLCIHFPTECDETTCLTSLCFALLQEADPDHEFLLIKQILQDSMSELKKIFVVFPLAS
jgi:hypothetical protein